MAKGQKTGGRTEGTPNVLTRELRTVLKNILHNEIELISEHFSKLEPKDRLELLIKFLPYAVPKLENVNFGTHEPLDFDFT